MRLYQREDCPDCRLARAQLAAHGVAYLTVNVARDPDARSELIAVSGRSRIPCLVSGHEVLVGVGAIEAWLAQRQEEDTRQEGAELRPRYALTRRLMAVPLPQAREKLQQVMAASGFRLIAATELGGLFAEGAGRACLLLVFAHSELAARALQLAPLALAGLVCSVVLSQEKGATLLCASRPALSLASFSPSADELAAREESMLFKAVSSM